MCTIHYKFFSGLLVLFAAILLTHCTASKVVTTPRTPVGEGEPAIAETDETFDPLMLDDEDITFPAPASNSQTPEDLPLSSQSDTQTTAEENQVVEGFRVQLFATKDIQNATLEKKEAEFVFLEDGVAVYIEYDSPMYKVRIGDCLTRTQAEQLRELARKKGYPSSWIVKTKVNTHPILPSKENENPEREGL